MKPLLLALMLLALQSNGQTEKTSYTLRSDSPQQIAFLKSGSDTLEIFPSNKIHFIKIGERVYKIESPVLTEVKKTDSVWHVGSRYFLPNYQLKQ